MPMVGQELDLSECSKISPKGIRALRDMPNLTSLDFSRTWVKSPSLMIKEIASLHGLKRLYLNDQFWLASLQSLEYLSMATWSCSANGLKQLSHLTNLRGLSLPMIFKSGRPSSSAILLHRAYQPQAGLKFRDSSLRFLSQLTKLTQLNVAGMDVDGSFLININPSLLQDLHFHLPRGDGLPSRLSKFTALTTLRIRECSGTVITKMPSWEKLTSLTTLKLPTVLFPADVFTELLDHLRALQCLSVSVSVLLLRIAHSDEPAIEYYDEHTFPTELRYLSFHQFTLRSFAPSKRLAAPKQEETYVADTITEDTVQHLSDILQASTPQLEVLKFKLEPVFEPLIRESALMDAVRSLHTLKFNDKRL